MKIYKIVFSCFLAVLVILMSNCSGNSGQPGSEKSTSKKRKISAGEIVYRQYCLSCHQLDGQGTKGMYPPLTDTEWVKGDNKTLIELVLNGQSGEQIVKGEKYTEEMPEANYLTNKEIAEVLTYVRSHFGNDYGAITAKEVGAIRAANRK